MRKIVVAEFLSLDGVMETPEAWHFPYISDDMGADIQANILAADAFLLGRVTYETFASYWPSQTNNEFGIADQLNNAPKYVVSTTLEKADWNNSTLISTNVIEEIAKLKQEPGGNIAINGSCRLVQSLMEAKLIDELQLMVHPIVVGYGMRLFKDDIATTALKLVESKTYQSGVVSLTYQHAEN